MVQSNLPLSKVVAVKLDLVIDVVIVETEHRAAPPGTAPLLFILERIECTAKSAAPDQALKR